MVENIKVLTYIFPSILTFTLLAQFGSFLTILFQSYDLSPLPSCIHHIVSFFVQSKQPTFRLDKKTDDYCQIPESGRISETLGRL